MAEESQPTAIEPVTKTLMWPDGTRYVGGVVDGKRTGKGTIFWQDGTRFVGNFKNDKRSGPGTMILPDGSVYNGTFENDELVHKAAEPAPSSTAASSTIPPDPIASATNNRATNRATELSEPVAGISARSLEQKEAGSTLSEASTPPPQNVPLYQPVTRMTEQTRKQLESTVDEWAAAWSRQDVDAYLAQYSTQFNVPGNQSRSQWEALRRSRLERPDFIKITVSFDKIEIVAADQAQVDFKQTYKSDRYEDVTMKRLELIKEDEAWRIRQERSI